MYSLTDKVALVTGAGGMYTVGRAVAERLAEEGARLALTDIKRSPEDTPEDELQQGWNGLESLARLIKQRRVDVLTHHADLRQPHEVQALVGGVISAYGRIDILVILTVR